MNTDTAAERFMFWIFAIASLVGLAWLWLNIDLPDMLIAKVIVVGVLWAFWIGVVAVAVALVALVLGMLGIVVKPFRR